MLERRELEKAHHVEGSSPISRRSTSRLNLNLQAKNARRRRRSWNRIPAGAAGPRVAARVSKTLQIAIASIRQMVMMGIRALLIRRLRGLRPPVCLLPPSLTPPARQVSEEKE